MYIATVIANRNKVEANLDPFNISPCSILICNSLHLRGKNKSKNKRRKKYIARTRSSQQ